MDLVEDIFRKALSARLADVDEIDVELLFDASAYADRISDSLEYENMYAFGMKQSNTEADLGQYVLRPDNLVSAADELRRHKGAGDRQQQRTVLTCGSLWRADTDRMAPLVRDRHMWRAIEAITLVPAGEVGTTQRVQELLAAHWDVMGEVCEALALPQIFYEAAGLRDHSTRCLMSLAMPDPDTLTLTSTLFELSPAMSRRLNLEGTLIDLGVTAKLLAISLMALADRWGLVLPTSIAPDRVIVGARRPEDIGAAQEMGRILSRSFEGVTVDTRPWGQVLRAARKRGVPSLVLLDGQGTVKLIHRITDESEDLGADPARQIADAMLAHDRQVHERSRRILDDALGKGEVVRLIDHDEPVPGGWFELGALRSIGCRPSESEYTTKGPRVLSHARRLY
jgi:hypothetical protein